MSATGIFAEAQATIAATLTGLGLAVVTDSRNARPMTVLIEPPTFICFNNNIAEITSAQPTSSWTARFPSSLGVLLSRASDHKKSRLMT